MDLFLLPTILFLEGLAETFLESYKYNNHFLVALNLRSNVVYT